MKQILTACVSITLSFLTHGSYAQGYTSYFTGNPSDVSTNPQFGICLMGGAGEMDEAMQWFLSLADSGDVLVLRTTGSDGYNDYFFNQLGVSLNSVETIRIDDQNAAVDSYVLQKLAQAEAIWFAGGDQADYVNYFKNTNFLTLLNAHINVKNYPVGGTSAGMAIFGEYYFDALNGTVTTQEALSNPYDPKISLGSSDFISTPFLSKTITDTHYDNPDRKGRHSVFLARLQESTNERVFGIGIDEYTAVCIDDTGVANVYGEFPSFQDFAYFVQINCLPNTTPETMMNNQPLDWNLNQESIKTYVVPGNSQGSNSFNLNTWESGNGGQWENWWIDQGMFMSQNATPVNCDNLGLETQLSERLNFYPNPAKNYLNISAASPIASIRIYDGLGKEILYKKGLEKYAKLDISYLHKGIYFAKIGMDDGTQTNFKFAKN